MYRPPAWPGLAPFRPEYVAAPDDLAAAITTALRRAGSARMIANASPGSTRGLRLDCLDGERLFVKLVPPARLAELLAGEAIARWLKAHGAPVVAMNDDPRTLATGDVAIAYPFCDGAPPGSGPADARALGLALAALHRALDMHPDRAAWQAATDARLRRLTDVRLELARGTRRAGPEPDRLAVLAANDAVSFLPEAFPGLGPSRPLHGDLNIFNVLLAAEGAHGAHGIVFLDFEDVVHSVLPAAFDVALLCERAILAAEPDEAAARASIAALLHAYAEAGGASIDRPAILPDILRGLALRSLCTLALIDPAGTDAGEWGKFFHLFEAAAARRQAFAGQSVGDGL